MSEELSLQEIQKHWPQTLRLYLSGLFTSLFLTILSFTFAGFKLLREPLLIPLLIFLAVCQAFAQLIFFMHMGKEAKPRWMMVVFYFMVLVLVIVVIGSLWIIADLNHRVMPDM